MEGPIQPARRLFCLETLASKLALVATGRRRIEMHPDFDTSTFRTPGGHPGGRRRWRLDWAQLYECWYRS